MKHSIKKRAHLPVNQADIEKCIATWREFCPNIMPVIFNDLTTIRREQEVVRIGHLHWLADKILGDVKRDAVPPTFSEAPRSRSYLSWWPR